jgi:hypothetical protein
MATAAVSFIAVFTVISLNEAHHDASTCYYVALVVTADDREMTFLDFWI